MCYFNLRSGRIQNISTALLLLFALVPLRAQADSSVLSFGAAPDGIMRMDGLMTAGSASLTSPSGTFTASDQGKYIQVVGAGAGGTSRSDGSMLAGSAVLTSNGGSFAPSDVGRGVVVVGAGSAGGNLAASIQGYASPTSVTLSAAAQVTVGAAPFYYGAMTLEATIQSVQSSSIVTLSSPAASTISAAMFAYGTDNHLAFQQAVDAAGAAGGGQVNVPAPANCPGGAVCGYVIKAVDQTTAKAPGAVKIRYNNVSLIGDSPQTNLFCRGAFGTYTNTVAFPGVTGNIRGFCLSVGDNGGPNGAAGEAVSNVTIARLHLYGMSNGNTQNINFAYPPQTPTGDGWDITHKGIYMWDNSVFSNITIDSVVIQDFKAENIYSGGSAITGMVIKNSTLKNFNGNGISMLAADLQVLNNTISNGSNAAIENNTVSSGASALVRQLYQGNTVSLMPREGIIVAGVDYGINSGSVEILNNSFDTIGQINGSAAQAAVYIGRQSGFTATANVTIAGNSCHDCYSFAFLYISGNSLVQGNTFTIDRYNAGNVFSFTNPLTGVTISNNTGSATAQALANNLSLGSVYAINPGYASGSFPWKNVVIKGNSWNFPGAPQYQFVTNSGLGWSLVSLDNLNWQGDVCTGCTHSDINHGLVNLSGTTLIEPYGPVVYVSGNTAPVTATVDARKEEDGAQIQIVNAGSNSVSFTSDSNLTLPSTRTLPGGSYSSLNLVFNASLGKFTLAFPQSTVTPTAGTPQSTLVNTSFATALQVIVKDGAGNPVSGAPVLFSTSGSGATATFSGAGSASALTGANGIATAPALTANGQTGNYTVTASVAAGAASASFSLTNTSVYLGALAGSATSSTGTVNLTIEGSLDWIHWGDSPLTRKAGVSPLIGSWQSVGSASASTYNNDPRPMAWTDGTPLASSSNANGLYLPGLGQGFSLTVPADKTIRTLIVHSGGWYSGGTFTAHLSDGSYPDFSDTSSPVNGQYDRNYTLTYNAASAGQSLIITWVMTSGPAYGNVTLSAAALGSSSNGGHAGAFLAGSANGSPSSANLSAEGAADWIHWGDYPLNRKLGVQAQISNFSAIGYASVPPYSNDLRVLTWSDGSPTVSASNSGGVYTPSIGDGFTFTAPADTTVRTLTVHCGGWYSGGTFTAHLSDMSAADFTDITPTVNGQYDRNYTLSYSAASAGQTLIIKWVMTSGPSNGNVTLSAAALTGSSSATAGSLTGSATSAVTATNLTTAGTSDWIHWGDTSLNRKAAPQSQISTYSAIGSNPVMLYPDDPRPISWSDGSPTVTGSNNTAGVYINSTGNGFSFTAPADTGQRTLTVYLGGWYSGGTLTAHLSDASAPDYTDITTTVNGQYDRTYTFTYNAASAGQTLRVTWINTSGIGNVTLNAAALK